MIQPALKLILIDRFKSYCSDPKNDSARKLTVTTQFSPDNWEMDDNLGKIRISKNPGYSLSKYSITGWFHTRGQCGFELDEDEYEDLKKCYFGSFAIYTKPTPIREEEPECRWEDDL